MSPFFTNGHLGTGFISAGSSLPAGPYLLQETGFRFLLEDGSGFLLLE